LFVNIGFIFEGVALLLGAWGETISPVNSASLRQAVLSGSLVLMFAFLPLAAATIVVTLTKRPNWMFPTHSGLRR
jgi:hypothetical protein